MRSIQPPLKPCTCKRTVESIFYEIKAAQHKEGSYPQEYVTLGTDKDAEIALICTLCSGEWDHRASDELIEQILDGQWVDRAIAADQQILGRR